MRQLCLQSATQPYTTCPRWRDQGGGLRSLPLVENPQPPSRIGKALLVSQDRQLFVTPVVHMRIKNRYLIVLAALVGGEQRTAVLLGQVGYGLNKRVSSYTNFKNIVLGNCECRSRSCCGLSSSQKPTTIFFKSEVSGK